jgi:hypothetical protein
MTWSSKSEAGLPAVRRLWLWWQVPERGNVVFWVTVGAVLKTIKEDYLAVDKARYRSTGKGFSGVGVHRSDEVCSLLRRRSFTVVTTFVHP